MSRYRTIELCRLDQRMLKSVEALAIGWGLNPQWLSCGEVSYSTQIVRAKYGVEVTLDDGRSYKIPITYTDLTYGKRPWWQCPNTLCNRRSGVLYLCRGVFVCRQCAKPAYGSQNDYKQTYLEDKVRELRRKLWKDDRYLEIDNLLDSCEWWPKPKWMRWHTFEKKRAQILEYERKMVAHWPALFRHYLQ